jgi:hypothetical protein
VEDRWETGRTEAFSDGVFRDRNHTADPRGLGRIATLVDALKLLFSNWRLKGDLIR